MTESGDLVDYLFATRQDRKQQRPVTVTPITPGAPVDGEDVVEVGDIARYVAAAVDRTVEDLALIGADTPDEGAGRNAALNTAAFSIGRFLGAGLVDEEAVRDRLLDACDRNSLLGWTGPHACMATITSGLRGGAAHPFAYVVKAPEGIKATPFEVPASAAGQLDEVVRTTWYLRDLTAILSGDPAAAEPPPVFLARTDGKHLIYAGKVNALIGESESGKTWVALEAVRQALGKGLAVLYLDFEDTAPGIVARLRSMGVRDKHMEALAYVGPEESLTTLAERDIAEVMAQHRPALVVVDGVNAAMTLLGLDLGDNKDATEFSLRVLRPLKRTGAGVITVDHVTKSKDNRGSYAIGAQAKRADIDGASLSVDVVQPFGRGMRGELKLTVAKDRPGHVRAVSGGAKAAGVAVLDSNGVTGSITVAIEPPSVVDPSKPFRPTVLMQRVSEFLEREGAQGRTAVKVAVTGENASVMDALDLLVEDGYVRLDPKSKKYQSAKVYRSDEDLIEKTSVRPFASVERPPDVLENVRPSPLPIGGRRTDASVDRETGEITDPWQEPNE